jgi:hypothetical protein
LCCSSSNGWRGKEPECYDDDWQALGFRKVRTALNASSLTERVDQVRSVARRWAWLHACSCTLVVLLVAAIVSALADYLLRPQSLVLRGMLSAVVVAALVLAARRWLWPAWAFAPSRRETAQRIELQWPELADRLASSVEFLSQSEDEPTAGSATLRRRVISAAQAASEDLDFRRAVNRQPAVKSLALAVAALALGLLLYVAFAPLSSTAALRLVAPGAAIQWPHRNQLRFVEPPERVAAGSDLELAVVDEPGPLPNEVWLDLQFDDGQRQTLVMKPLAGRVVSRLDHVTRGFRYRAHGGDDDTMPWQSIEVVDPLRLSDLQATVVPPAYAGPSRPGVGSVLTILEGSSIRITGRADQGVASGVIKRQGSADRGVEVAGNDRGEFSTPSPWKPTKSGTYILSLVSAEGVSSGSLQNWEVRLLPDAPPTLTVTSPTDAAYATPRARLPIKAVVKDDLALASVVLKFSRPQTSTHDASQPADATAASANADSELHDVPLWQADANPLLAAREQATLGETRTIEASWDLETLASIAPGDVLTWYLEAADFRPQAGRSPAARLTILSAEEMQQRLAQRQATALAQLAEALSLQRQARSQIASLEGQWQTSPAWRPQDRDVLHSAELHQRQVQALTGRTSVGAATILASVITDVEVNRLDLPEMLTTSEEVLGVLDRLTAEDFADVGLRLGELVRQARSGETQRTLSGLRATLERQDKLVTALEALLDQLRVWDTFQRLRVDLSQLREEHAQFMSQAQRLQAEVVTAGLGAQQRATAQHLAREELELLRRFERWQQRLTEFSQREGGDPSAARTATEVLEAAGRLALTAAMREASQALTDGKFGQSLERQQAVDGGLRELLDLLSGRRTGEPEQTLQQLRDLANSLRQLETDQTDLAGKLESDDAPEKLADEQQQLADKAAKAAQALEQQAARPAAQSTSEAASSMSQAAAAAREKKAADAAQSARAGAKQLKEARQSLQQQIVQREADLLREQMARLEQHVEGALVRQRAIKKESERLLNLQESQGNLTPAQLESARSSSAEQTALAEDTRALAAGSQMPDAFQFQLTAAAQAMDSAAQRLNVQPLASDAVKSQHQAILRLETVLDALKTEPNSGNEGNGSQQGDTPPKPPQEEGPTPDIHDLAEVKLLRAMQAEVNRRTAELQAERGDDDRLPPSAMEELASLAVEQGRIAELALKLARNLGAARTPKNPQSETPQNDDELLKKLDEALLPE